MWGRGGVGKGGGSEVGDGMIEAKEGMGEWAGDQPGQERQGGNSAGRGATGWGQGRGEGGMGSRGTGPPRQEVSDWVRRRGAKRGSGRSEDRIEVEDMKYIKATPTFRKEPAVPQFS